MLCKWPYIAGSSAYGCGRCMPCRVNKAREWSHRLELEAFTHPGSVFVTLTYDEDQYPSDGSVDKKELQLWLKRYRKKVGKVRYFAVGEYGSETWRAHYHAVLFGVCLGLSHGWEVSGDSGCQCEVCCGIRSTWGKGFCQVQEFNTASAQYIAGYVIKKLTRSTEWTEQFLQGRAPEFAIMSLKPGIGAKAMELAAPSVSRNLARGLSLAGDVPSSFRHGSKQKPLGRYLTGRLRLEAGFEDAGAPEGSAALVARREEMLALRERSKEGEASFRSLVTDHQRAAEVEARQRIYRKKESL